MKIARNVSTNYTASVQLRRNGKNRKNCQGYQDELKKRQRRA
jgi:hypothetical protein